MPLYDCKCASGHLFERQIPLSAFPDPIICECGSPSWRLISGPRYIASGIDYSYDCPITGKHITSKQAHEENLKVHNCRIYETGERDYNARSRAAAEKSLDAKIETTVERAIDQMPSEKRELLAKALSSGVNVEVERH